MEKVIKQTRIGKADGENKLPRIYQIRRKVKKRIFDLFRQVWKEELRKKYNYTHTQKGPKTRCKNYRALCLPTVLIKLYSRILGKRLRKVIEDKLEEEQSTFRPIRQRQGHYHLSYLWNKF